MGRTEMSGFNSSMQSVLFENFDFAKSYKKVLIQEELSLKLIC